MNPISFIILTVVSSLLLLASDGACPDSVFLLAGQSNMVGRGGTYINQIWDGVVPVECQPDPRILRLNSEGMWEEAVEPLHGNISFGECPNSGSDVFGVGPGIAFASTLLGIDAAVGTVGLVPCAVGGTPISLWGRGSCLYERLLARASASLSCGGALRGMLWYQGENDAMNQTDADMYGERLREFFDDVRSDLMAPSLPIIQVALALPPNSTVEEVRAAQLGLTLPNVTTIDAAGLPMNGDDVHLTTESQVKLGAMFAHAFFDNFE